MRLLAIDIGGLTQDILLFDTSRTIENCIKLVMPSPAAILAGKIAAATEARRALFFNGATMGGIPATGALMNHLKAGLKAYATPQAAATFNDDLSKVAKWGVTIVAEKEIPLSKGIIRIETEDLNFPRIEKALRAFDIEPAFDSIAVAVLDHGKAPPEVSDRLFRFQHLRQTVNKRRELIAFAYLANEVPPYLTRMKSVAKSVKKGMPLLIMDTPVAAVLGSLEDREVARHHQKVVVNVGNFHTLAFHLENNSILGFFEHHTGLLTRSKLEKLISKLVTGKLTNEEIYKDDGHGCLILESRREIPFVSVTGPQRGLMYDSKLSPYFAAPYGDMMLTGCFGLVRAFATRVTKWRREIEKALG